MSSVSEAPNLSEHTAETRNGNPSSSQRQKRPVADLNSEQQRKEGIVSQNPCSRALITLLDESGQCTLAV